MQLSPEFADDSLVSLIDWLISVQDWKLLGKLSERFVDRIEASSALTYVLADAYMQQGQDDVAGELATRAFELDRNDEAERVDDGILLHRRGLLDWALREYEAAIDALPVLAPDSWFNAYEARQNASQIYHDRLEHSRASEILAPFVQAARKNGDNKIAFLLRATGARMEYYAACQAEADEDYEEQRLRLERAMSYSDEDADVLIALYRLSNVDEEYRQRTRDTIRQVTAEFQRRINQEPDKPSNYNQWAWLISNTEGDFEKAIRYSQKSLELRPGEASYLDTLGRCYFAAGNLTEAIKHQRLAVAADPHMLVMQRQLEAFEAAQEARQEDTNGEQPR